MKRKFKVTLDGQEREVEVDINLDELLTEETLTQRGLLTPQQVSERYSPKDAFEAELARRVESITKGKVKLEDIPNDKGLRDQVLKLLGVEVTEDGKAKLTADQVADLQTDWRKKELDPANERAEKAESKTKSLLRRILHSEIVQFGAAAGVEDHMLSPVVQGQVPAIVAMVEPLFRFSEEHDGFFVGKGEEGFEFSSDPKKWGRPFKSTEEFMSEWTSRKENLPFVKKQKPGGPGLKEPGKQGGTVTIEKGDGPVTLQDYQAAQDAAGEGGSVVVKDSTVPSEE